MMPQIASRRCFKLTMRIAKTRNLFFHSKREASRAPPRLQVVIFFLLFCIFFILQTVLLYSHCTRHPWLVGTVCPWNWFSFVFKLPLQDAMARSTTPPLSNFFWAREESNEKQHADDFFPNAPHNDNNNTGASRATQATRLFCAWRQKRKQINLTSEWGLFQTLFFQGFWIYGMLTTAKPHDNNAVRAWKKKPCMKKGFEKIRGKLDAPKKYIYTNSLIFELRALKDE